MGKPGGNSVNSGGSLSKNRTSIELVKFRCVIYFW